ncbi:hypothetical protein HZB03_04985 [Candidatus Woesearchaeota archaeon]|nr:hypothetical protein [Candidatus Woesearchaeota archaeon]
MHQITSSKQLKNKASIKQASIKPEENDYWVEDDDASEDDVFEDEDTEVAADQGSKGQPAEPTEVTKIKDLKKGLTHVTVEAKIEFVGEGNRKGAGYGENIYAPAFLRDNTGEIKLVFWNDDARKAKAGKKVRVVDGYVTMFHGELQLNTNKKKGVEFL